MAHHQAARVAQVAQRLLPWRGGSRRWMATGRSVSVATPPQRMLVFGACRIARQRGVAQWTRRPATGGSSGSSYRLVSSWSRPACVVHEEPKVCTTAKGAGVDGGVDGAQDAGIVERQEQHRVGDTAALRDRFGRQHSYLRISLTEKCNLRCQYCMPEQGVELTPLERLLTSEEIVRLASLFAQCGVDKIRLTGGEPLVRRDATDICAQLAALPGIQGLSLTTNGLLVKRRLPQLVEAGVTGINISLDTMLEPKFLLMTRRQGHGRVLEAIDACVDAGLTVKVNCVVMNGVNEDELVDFVEFTRHKPVDVRFIEYMPFDDNAWSDRKMLPYLAMLDTITAAFPDTTRLRNSVHDTAKTYQVPGFAGKFGFITSMTQHFCGGCNRLRLTADGNIKACLFGSDEFSLRDAMRDGATDEELLNIIAHAVQRKHFALGGNKDMYGIAASDNRPMITIGG